MALDVSKNGLYMVQRNGLMVSITNYKDGKFDGVQEFYRGNKAYGNKVFNRQRYVDGKLEGIQEIFSEKGLLEVRANYKNDALEGLTEEFDGNGILLGTSYYHNDELDGPYTQYDINGNVEKIKMFKNGHYVRKN